MVKIGKYIGFCVYRRSYLLWSPVVALLFWLKSLLGTRNRISRLNSLRNALLHLHSRRRLRRFFCLVLPAAATVLRVLFLCFLESNMRRTAITAFSLRREGGVLLSSFPDWIFCVDSVSQRF